jgi:hypothetical protein
MCREKYKMASEKWSVEQAWQWHNSSPWLRGCNFIPSDCCNRIDFWQSLNWEKHIATADRELALAASAGLNSVRMILEFTVLDEEHDSFMERFEEFLTVIDKHCISAMICFGNDCTVPKNANYRAPHLGVQEYDWGYHGGRKNSPHGSNPGKIGYSLLDEPEIAERYYRYEKEIITKYANDKRICVWDLFNEPGNSRRGEISVPHVKRMFEVARSCNPSQPLTTGVWHQPWEATPAELTALELSDVISFHCYGSYHSNIRVISYLKEKFGRPILNTEWLNRIQHNNVQEVFPLFYLERIHCWHWGLVAGLSQTYEPWQSIWNCYEAEMNNLDVTKWQHDIFRANGKPYDPKEIKIFKYYSELADGKISQDCDFNEYQGYKI